MEINDLKKYKIITGYNLAQLEKDYLQHIILEFIYRNKNNILFKGGTCLQKIYGIKRFSEDLDFNIINEKPDKIIENVIKYLNLLNYPSTLKKENKNEFGKSYIISIHGLLYDGNQNTLCNITLDFRYNDTYLLPMQVKIEPIYSNIKDYLVVSLHIDEIASEKVRAIMTRNKARDVYDLNKLIDKKIVFNLEIINNKLKTYNLKFNYKLFNEKLEDKNKFYDNELSKLINVFPKFNECKRNILKWIKE